jgi:hypothetical protein
MGARQLAASGSADRAAVLEPHSPVDGGSLLVGVLLAVQAKYATPIYFGTEVSLFPKWPVFDAQKALMLLVATILIVHLPKLLGAAWALRNRTQRWRRAHRLQRAGGIGPINSHCAVADAHANQRRGLHSHGA